MPAFTAVPTASAACALGGDPRSGGRRRATRHDRGGLRGGRHDAPHGGRRARAPLRPASGRRAPSSPVAVIEDAAQAHGAVPGPRLARAVAYSFYPPRTSAASATAARSCTDDDGVAEIVRRLRVHGMTEMYRHVDVSQNFRMSELEAAWLRLQLPSVGHGHGAATADRRPLPRRRPAPRLAAGPPVARVPPLRVPGAATVTPRAALADAGVGTAVHYPLSIPDQPAYARFARADCPNARDWAAGACPCPASPS